MGASRFFWGECVPLHTRAHHALQFGAVLRRIQGEAALRRSAASLQLSVERAAVDTANKLLGAASPPDTWLDSKCGGRNAEK